MVWVCWLFCQVVPVLWRRSPLPSLTAVFDSGLGPSCLSYSCFQVHTLSWPVLQDAEPCQDISLWVFFDALAYGPNIIALVCFCLGGGSLLDELINHRFFLVLLVSVSTLQLLSRVLGLCWCLQGLPVVYCSSGRNIWTHCSVLLYNNSKNRDIH